MRPCHGGKSLFCRVVFKDRGDTAGFWNENWKYAKGEKDYPVSAMSFRYGPYYQVVHNISDPRQCAGCKAPRSDDRGVWVIRRRDKLCRCYLISTISLRYVHHIRSFAKSSDPQKCARCKAPRSDDRGVWKIRRREERSKVTKQMAYF